MKERPLILVCNDDGIQAEGLRLLVAALAPIARVVVVAPDREQSASSHSLTLHRPLRVNRQGPDLYAVNGTPTDCITLAVHSVLRRRPDLIVSGINRGANLCDDVHYSGTVSAAIEGALLMIPAVAASLVVFGEARCHFRMAAAFTARLCRRLLREKITGSLVLNVNFPNIPARQIRGYSFTKLGKRDFGEVIFEKIDPRGKKYYWIGGDDRRFENVPGSDGNAIQEKRISITPLQVDLTHYPLLEEMRYWKV